MASARESPSDDHTEAHPHTCAPLTGHQRGLPRRLVIDASQIRPAMRTFPCRGHLRASPIGTSDDRLTQRGGNGVGRDEPCDACRCKSIGCHLRSAHTHPHTCAPLTSSHGFSRGIPGSGCLSGRVVLAATMWWTSASSTSVAGAMPQALGYARMPGSGRYCGVADLVLATDTTIMALGCDSVGPCGPNVP